MPFGFVRAAAYVLFGWQVYQGLRRPLDDFEVSYWLVGYHHGFVRRGLTGAVFDALIGHPTRRGVEAAALLITLVTLAAVLLVVEWLLRSGTAAACRLALLLACSPFAVDYIASQRRPDQLGLALLVALGAVLLRSRRRQPLLCAAAGLGFGLLVLVHEGIVLYDLPFAALMVVAVLRLRRGAGTAADYGTRVRSALLGLLVPPAAALLAVTAFGSVDAATNAHLQAEAPIRLHGLTMFTFLPDTLRQAVARVARGGLHGPHVAMVVFGVTLLGLHAYWMQRWSGRRLERDIASSVGLGPARLLLAVVAGAAAVLFAIGIDWIRWFAALGAAWMIVSAFVLLAGAEVQSAGPRRSSVNGGAGVRLPPLLILTGLYLVLLPPLPTAATADGVLRLALLGR